MTGDDCKEIERLKKRLAKEFKIKDLGRLKFFLRIEATHSRKYILDLLKEIGMLGRQLNKIIS